MFRYEIMCFITAVHVAKMKLRASVGAPGYKGDAVKACCEGQAVRLN